MKAKKVLFINQEITPYVPESEMSHLGRVLPQTIQEKDTKYGLSCLSGAISTSVGDSCMR